MKCVLADGLDGFPGTLTTTLTYSITKDNGLSIAYEATTDKATVVNLSNHSYFNLKGVGNGDILDHMLTVSAANITETDRMGIPTGKLTPVAGTAYDFNKPVKIGDRQVAVQEVSASVSVSVLRFLKEKFATTTITSASPIRMQRKWKRLLSCIVPSQDA